VLANATMRKAYAATTDARIIPEFWRIFFCCSLASQNHVLRGEILGVNDM